MGIITAKKQELALKITKYLKIYKYFNYIIGETEEFKSKLDPRFKELLFNKYSGYKFVVIGDHPNDGMLAKNLNCPFVGVLTGFHKADQLKQVKNSKTLIINNLSDLTVSVIYSLF
jgi:phosphoglycolate phosphatase-like HAD superfamily hydrolase